MPKRSKKSKSKRLSLKQKYKVVKKVKEHHKKKRKELKKSGKKPKEPKDPGIPSQWPFKEELLKEMAWKRQQILMQEKQKKEERKRAREEKASADAEMEAEDKQLQQLATLQAGASHKQADFEARKRAKLATDGARTGDADNSRRAFYKEFKKVVEASDVVIQVLDARDPAGCRCPDVERYVRSLDPSKRVILLLNKMDLVPREVGEAWLKYYRQEIPAVAFKANTQQQSESLSRKEAAAGKKGKKAAGAGDSSNKQESFAAGSGCLGADTLLQLLKNYARNAGGGKGSICVGVIGLPNVGKSSLINSLKRARVAQVGSTPGVTKGIQEVHLDKQIKLLDSPGIVFTSEEGAAAAALRNAIKVERLEDPLTPVGEILSRVPAKQLMSTYSIAAFDGLDQFLQHIAEARGKLKKGGLLDVEAAARIVLQDWTQGRIPYFTLPPQQRPNQQYDTAEVVSGWAAEFDADRVFADEATAVIQHLPSLEDEGAAFFEAASAGNVAVRLEDMEAEDVPAAADEGTDAMDGDVDEYGLPSSSSGRGQLTKQQLGQNAGLYNELGQHNPKKAKAERQRLKKAKADFASFAAAAGDEDNSSDFDFDEANEEQGLAGASSEGEGEAEEGEEEEEEEEEEEMSGGDGDSGSEEEGGEAGDGQDGSSEEYGAGSDDDEDADRKYEDAMES